MDRIRSVVIVGLGALGTYFADAFQRSGAFDVSVLVDPERKARYTAAPRVLNGREVAFRYVLPDETDHPADFILICVKSNGMHQAVDMIRNYVGEETVIISLMNGVSIEDLLIERYGAEHVVFTIYKGTAILNLEGKVQSSDVGNIYFGDVGNPRDAEQVKLLSDAFDRAAVKYHVEDDMLYTYWQKFAISVGLIQLCAVLDTSNAVFTEVPESIDLGLKLIDEIIPLARAAGVTDPERFREDIVIGVKFVSPDGMSSTEQDRRAKRRMETDIFSGEVVRRSAELGLAAPYNEIVYRILDTINKFNGYE
ncbi:MAG: ketopantoate reductase family protein [Mogibacterium sp.]|nr:ketopantoate reductase family protein [Mogibacterium sp.]